jgi:hypothetical protein
MTDEDDPDYDDIDDAALQWIEQNPDVLADTIKWQQEWYRLQAQFGGPQLSGVLFVRF